MDKNLKIYKKKVFVGELEFDAQTGELIVAHEEQYQPSFAERTSPFSGVKDGRVIVNNKVTAIDAQKFLALPKSIRERILLYPNSDYARDILSQPKGSVTTDTFPNFKDISYTLKGEAIIMNDDSGFPTRKPFFLD